MVQWLGFSAFTAAGLGLIPCQGTKISQVMWYGQKSGFCFVFFFFLMWGLFLIHEWECNVFLLQNVVETMFLRNVLNHNPELLEQKLRVWGQPASVLANPTTQFRALSF